MIPTIETIIEDLLADTISKQQAIKWLHQHAEDGAQTFRDYFAAKAMAAILAADYATTASHSEKLAAWSYQFADAMLAERSRTSQGGG